MLLRHLINLRASLTTQISGFLRSWPAKKRDQDILESKILQHYRLFPFRSVNKILKIWMRCFSTATFFSTATLKFYCRFYCHFYCHFLVAVEPKNLSTASGSRDQKTVLQPLAVEFKNSSTASGSRIQKSFYCHFYCHIYRDYEEYFWIRQKKRQNYK